MLLWKNIYHQVPSKSSSVQTKKYKLVYRSQNSKHLGRATKQSISLNVFHTSSLFQSYFCQHCENQKHYFSILLWQQTFLLFKASFFLSHLSLSMCLYMWTLFSFKICTVSFTKGSYSKHIMYVLPYPAQRTIKTTIYFMYRSVSQDICRVVSP